MENFKVIVLEKTEFEYPQLLLVLTPLGIFEPAEFRYKKST